MKHIGIIGAGIAGLHLGLFLQRHPYMRMPILGASGLRSVIVGAGLMAEAELDQTLSEMERIITAPETYETSFTVTQVWGRRPR